MKLKMDTQFEGRIIKVWELQKGGYRYATTVASDGEPSISVYANSLTEIPSVTKGQVIEDSVNDINALERALIEAEFSIDTVKQVISSVAKS